MLFSRTGMLLSPHLLQPLAMHHVSHRVSFFVDDAVMFLRPSCTDLQTIKLILDYFGHASGLRINWAKSSVSPIHCSETDLLLTSEILSCPVKDFPCTYLGLPSPSSLGRADYLSLLQYTGNRRNHAGCSLYLLFRLYSRNTNLLTVMVITSE